MTSPALSQFRRVVLKVGSALLVDEATGRLRRAWLDALADDVARCRRRGQEVVLVSSGAIAAGLAPLGLGQRPQNLASAQAAAGSLAVPSTRWSSTRQRSTWPRKRSPSPAPSCAPSISPGMSARISCRSSASIVPSTGCKVVKG